MTMGTQAAAPKNEVHDLTPIDAPVAEPAPGVTLINGKEFMSDSAGRLVPVDMVKDSDKLIDQTVRKIIAYATEESARIARLKGHCFDDVFTTQDLISEKYGVKVGGTKGNITLTTVDGCQKVTVQVQDQISFGPELQAAKELVDECIAGWAEGARDEMRALVAHAFQVDKEGRINRGALFQLRRVAITDPTWQRAIEAISDSIRVTGSQTYMRFYRRENSRGRWEPVTIDMAAA